MAARSVPAIAAAAAAAGVLAAAGYAAYQALARADPAKPRKKGVTYVSDASPVVLLEYADIVNGVDLSEAIEAAYGFGGLGILAVRGVPKFAEQRQRLLPMAHRFANLPAEVKAKYEHKDSQYSFGWSHGKEQFNGKPDFAKGSFYNNPIFDAPFTDPELIKKYPSFAMPNIWPAEMPELKAAFMELGRTMVDVGMKLGEHCDRYVRSKLPTYQEKRLHNIIRDSRTPKARLLYYFPMQNPEEAQQKAAADDDMGNWCGWHNDHGSLTALCPAMFIDENDKEISNPDPNAGLYIKSRSGKTVKAVIPSDCLAFQIGETEQIHSAGVLMATPHCVRSSAMKGVGRATYAVFMEPEWAEPMSVPAKVDPASAITPTTNKYLPPGVPALESRWDNAMDFGSFSAKTLETYAVMDKHLAEHNAK